MAIVVSDSHDPSDRSQTEIDRMRQEQFEPGRWIVWQHSHTWRPPTDVYETDEAVVVRVEIAGMREADFSVTLHDQLLVIAGERTDPSPKVAYHQLEVRYGNFRVEAVLHWQVDEAHVTASYQDGFLVVKLPKSRIRRVKVIEIGEHAG